ncbi:MAG: eCIS core domain-containing protein [Akkermansiaceae bacterium]
MKTIETAKKPSAKASKVSQPTVAHDSQAVSDMQSSVSSVVYSEPDVVMIQRACACGGTCPECQKKKLGELGVQTSLKVNEPGDRWEREADRMADQVVRMPDADHGQEVTASTSPTMMRKESAGTAKPTPSSNALNLGGGKPLAANDLNYFNSRFGNDFSAVKIHDNSRADQMANALNARAFTYGNNIAFSKGKSDTSTREGKHLMAHELTHVLQQERGLSQGIQRQLFPPERLTLCALICACRHLPLSQVCVSASLEAMDASLAYSSTLKPEINYNMTTTPPTPIMSRSNTRRGTRYLPERLNPRNGSPGLIPGFTPATGMVRRPDVIAVWNPALPPEQSNIRAVVEIKFPPDYMNGAQRAAYIRIAGGAPLIELGPRECNCDTMDVTALAAATALLAASQRSRIAAMMTKLGSSAGGRVAGPAYAAAVMASMAILLSSEDAQASLSIDPTNPDSRDPIAALIEYLSSNGVGAPDELRQYLDSRPELKSRLEEAMQNNDLEGVSRELQAQTSQLISDNLDQFTEDELEALLTGTEGMQAGNPDMAPTVESLRESLSAERGSGGNNHGSSEGGASGGSEEGSSSAGEETEVARGAVTEAGSTEVSGRGTGSSTSVLDPLLEEQLSRNQLASALWGRITQRGESETGPLVTNSDLQQFLVITQNFSQAEFDSVTSHLSAIEEENLTSQQVMDSIDSHLRAIRQTSREQLESDEAVSEAELLNELRDKFTSFNWTRVENNEHQVTWSSSYDQTQSLETVATMYGRDPDQFVAIVTIRFASEVSDSYTVTASNMRYYSDNRHDSGASLIGKTGNKVTE